MVKNSSLRTAVLMWGIVALFYFYQFFLRVYPSVLSDEIMHHFGIGAASLGTLVGCYYYIYTALQIPIGLFLDKFGTKLVVIVSILCCTFGSFLFVCSQNYYVSVLGRCLIGLGSASSFCACLKIATSWFAPKHVTLLTTITVSIGSLGPIFGVPLFATLLKTHNWITILYYVSAVGLLLLILTQLILKDSPLASKPKVDTSIKFWDSCKSVLSNKSLYIMLGYGFCTYAPISAFADMWGVPFLSLQHPGISLTEASILTNAIYVGMIFGPVLSPVAERFGKLRIMIISSIAMFVFFLWSIVYDDISYTMNYFCIFMVGFFATGQLFVYPIAYNIMPANLSGLISGVVNTAAMLSGSILQPLLGKILDMSWNGYVVDGLPYYDLSCYKAGFYLVSALLAVSIFIPMFIHETKR